MIYNEQSSWNRANGIHRISKISKVRLFIKNQLVQPRPSTHPSPFHYTLVSLGYELVSEMTPHEGCGDASVESGTRFWFLDFGLISAS